MNLSIVIPVYNEEKIIAKNIKICSRYLEDNFPDYELIIVNDGSTDNTLRVIKKVAEKYPKIKIINYKKNRGKGFAVRQGLLLSQGDYCLFLDADLSTSINHLDLAKKFIDNKKDLIIGSRHEKDNPHTRLIIAQPAWKRMLGRSGNFLIRFLLLPNIWDTQCGFKILSNNLINEIIPLSRVNNWAFDVELLTLAQQKKISPITIPVQWINHKDSKVKKSDYLKTLFTVIKIKFNFLLGRYKK